MLTQQQLEARRGWIGGSDAQDVMNEPPYGCARRLWFEKRGVQPDYPLEYSRAMERGNDLEDAAAQLYVRRTGRGVNERSTFTPTVPFPFAGVNIDREIEPIDERGPGVLEVKTHAYWLFRKVQAEGLQAGHILQIQHALMVTGYRWGSFAVLHPDSWTLLWFDAERDDELIAALASTEERFWRTVQHGPMPDPLPEVDQRCKGCAWRRSCRGDELLRAAKLTSAELHEQIEQDPAFDELLADYRTAKEQLDGWEATTEQIKERIRQLLADRMAIECGNGRVYYRPQTSMRWDLKLLEAKHPELSKEFKRPSHSRPLRIYPT